MKSQTVSATHSKGHKRYLRDAYIISTFRARKGQSLLDSWQTRTFRRSVELNLYVYLDTVAILWLCVYICKFRENYDLLSESRNKLMRWLRFCSQSVTIYYQHSPTLNTPKNTNLPLFTKITFNEVYMENYVIVYVLALPIQSVLSRQG